MSKSKASSAIAVAAEPVTTDHQGGEFKEALALSDIRKSPDNRKRFNAAALNDLAASIKVQGVIQPIVVRPVIPTEGAPEAYEIVAGERRYRASIIAELATIPAMARQLTDLQAAKIRILENVQREDPHPLEEAEGYQQLMLTHGYTADQLAEEIKKSRSHIYGRLKLCALNNDVREQFLDDKIPSSVALLIARIPTPALQNQALKEILTPNTWPQTEPMSFRRAQQHIQDRYMLDLEQANFSLTDARLLASAGACSKCPKRTGNQAEVFEGISANVCTDPDCFGEKKAAQHAITIVAANKKGIPVLEGQEASKLIQSQYGTDVSEMVSAGCPLAYLKRNAPATKNGGAVSNHLPAEALPPVAAYAKKDDGTVIAFYKRDAVQAALEEHGICETVDAHAARMANVATKVDEAKPAGPSAAEVARLEIEQRAEAETSYRVKLYKMLRQRAATNGLSLQSLREFTKLAVQSFALPDDILTDTYDFDTSSDESLRAHIDLAELPEIQLILVDLLVGEHLSVGYWDMKNSHGNLDADGFASVVAMAKAEGIDHAQVKRTMQLEALTIPELDAMNLTDFLRAFPDRIREVKDFIFAERPLLVTPLELAAKDLGYSYAAGEFFKPGDGFRRAVASIAAEQVNAEGISTTEVDTDPGLDMAEIENAEAVAKPASKTRKPAAKAITTATTKQPAKAAPAPAPAAAWPWPTKNSVPTAEDATK